MMGRFFAIFLTAVLTLIPLANPFYDNGTGSSDLTFLSEAKASSYHTRLMHRIRQHQNRMRAWQRQQQRNFRHVVRVNKAARAARKYARHMRKFQKKMTRESIRSMQRISRRALRIKNASSSYVKKLISRQYIRNRSSLLAYTKSSKNYWSRPINFQGNKVYKRNDLINPKLTDARGRSNIERMRKGLAPIGPDGKSINLHHMTQRQRGGIAEMTQTFHKKYSKTIHINSNSVQSGIDRNAFNKWRTEYWKSRANDFRE